MTSAALLTANMVPWGAYFLLFGPGDANNGRMAEMAFNRRRHIRFETTLVVRRGKGQAPMIAHDLSLGGMQVSTATPLWPGQGFDASLVLQGLGTIPVHCRVNELVEIPCGIGLSLVFVRLSDESIRAISDYLKRLAGDRSAA